MTWTSSELAARAASARDLAIRHTSLVRDVATRTEAGWLRYEACHLVVEAQRRRRILESGRMLPALPVCSSGRDRLRLDVTCAARGVAAGDAG